MGVQGYWTPPEEEPDIPVLPQFDEALLAGAPPELLRSRPVQSWLPDTGPLPSDIVVERGPGAGPGSDTASTGRRSLYAGCGYSREYFRQLTGDYPAPAPGSPAGPLLPPGSPASEASKSPQRSPRSPRPPAPYWGFRSFQNPIGSVYHEQEEGGEWGGWGGEEEGGPGRGQDTRPEEDRAWAGRNLLPYETLSGANYYAGFPSYYGGGAGGGADQCYAPASRTPPLYTSAGRQPQPAQLASLAPFLPRSVAAPGSGQYLQPGPVASRERSGPRPARPYSAEVGRLLSVQEGSEGEQPGPAPPSHRRSSSYGSEGEAGRGQEEGGLPGFPGQLGPPQFPEPEYYCEYSLVHL